MADFDGIVLRGDAWRGHDFGGARVAVIARGSEAARITPSVLRTAASVKVFQQAPDWVLPRVPGARLASRVGIVRHGVGRLHLRLRVRDPWTRRLLTPDQHFGGRAVRAGGDYYRALHHPKCTLVAWPVYAIVPGGVRTADGIEHRVDCIILGGSAGIAGEDFAA
jgi:cation diffusion facilitator CzcD-associated flavoprotein CzcO